MWWKGIVACRVSLQVRCHTLVQSARNVCWHVDIDSFLAVLLVALVAHMLDLTYLMRHTMLHHAAQCCTLRSSICAPAGVAAC